MAANTYLSVTEAARLLGVSRTTVWRWIGQGRLRAYRVGARTIRIKDQDIQQQLHEVVTGLPMAQEQEKDDLPTDYDPEKALAALRSMRGILKGVDRDQLQRDIREGRSQADRSRRG